MRGARRVVLGRASRLGPPSGLFASGEQGFWFDPSDLSTMWQDSAGSTPAVVDSPVGLILDKSGRGNHASQATDTNRPILRADGALRYLEFDGSTDYLATASLTLGGDAVSVFAGAHKASDAAAGLMLATGGTEQISVFAPVAIASASFTYRSRTTGDALATSLLEFAAPVTVVLAGQSDVSDDTCTIRLNGVQKGSAVTDQGTGNFAAATFQIGRRASGSLFFNGRIYGLVVVGRAVTAGELAANEAFMATRTGITL